MRPPETVYRGERGPDGTFVVTADGRPFVVRRRLPGRGLVAPVAWGYGGTSPAQLAHALVLDATGDAHLAAVSCVWMMWAIVANWGERWEITAGAVAKWVEQWRREARSARLAERYDWAAVPVGWSPPAVVRATGTDGPEPRPAARSLPTGRVKLYPPAPADGLEGGGV